ncbi:MAG: EAL domain-containing response regulator, partial [Pseudomonadota bacterium]
MSAATTVLVIDGSLEDAEPALDALASRGLAAHVATSLADTRSALAGEVDLVILELMLSPHDGVEMIREIAAAARPPELIVFSRAGPRIRTSAERLARARGLRVRAVLDKSGVTELSDALAEAPHRRPDDTVDPSFVPTADDLRHGIDNGEIRVLFQPKIRLDSLAPVSVEALARWTHPRHGPVSPQHFVSVAERHDLIGPLTDAVIDSAFVSTREWMDNGLPLRLAVNVSGASLANLGLPDHLARRAADHAIEPDCITVEITETWFEQYPIDAPDIMTRLRMKGFELAIDDFGTGHSTMLRLKQAPFSELKLDQSLTRGAASDPVARRIVASSIELGHALGLSVIAEGVDNQKDWDLITDLGCDV